MTALSPKNRNRCKIPQHCSLFFDVRDVWYEGPGTGCLSSLTPTGSHPHDETQFKDAIRKKLRVCQEVLSCWLSSARCFTHQPSANQGSEDTDAGTQCIMGAFFQMLTAPVKVSAFQSTEGNPAERHDRRDRRRACLSRVPYFCSFTIQDNFSRPRRTLSLGGLHRRTQEEAQLKHRQGLVGDELLMGNHRCKSQ